MSREILLLVDALAREKNVAKDIVFGALETALASATKKRINDEADVRVALDICRDLGVPIVPRGGGTSQCGQTVGAGLVIDHTKHMRRVIDVDVAQRTAEGDRQAGAAGAQRYAALISVKIRRLPNGSVTVISRPQGWLVIPGRALPYARAVSSACRASRSSTLIRSAAPGQQSPWCSDRCSTHPARDTCR